MAYFLSCCFLSCFVNYCRCKTTAFNFLEMEELHCSTFLNLLEVKVGACGLCTIVFTFTHCFLEIFCPSSQASINKNSLDEKGPLLVERWSGLVKWLIVWTHWIWTKHWGKGVFLFEKQGPFRIKGLDWMKNGLDCMTELKGLQLDYKRQQRNFCLKQKLNISTQFTIKRQESQKLMFAI